MNVVGIESRRTWTVVGLREGAHPPRLVGDGRRPVIPNAVVAGGSWGSDAASNPDAAWDGTRADTGGLGDAAPAFWNQLRGRVTRYLGGVDPASHDYRAVVAADAEGAGASLARSSGFGDAMLISPPEAAVAGWLAGQARAGAADGERIVAVVTIGDVAAEVAAFEVRVGRDPAVVRTAGAATLPRTGAAYWIGRLVSDVTNQLPGPPPAALRLALWQFGLEFGGQLRRAGPRALIAWSGPLENRLLTPVRISVDDFTQWSETKTLTSWLPQVVRDAVRALDRDAPDVLVLAGLGALWPLPPEAFDDLPPPVVSDDPTGDIAVGATWWPELFRPAMTGRPAWQGPSLPNPQPSPLPPRERELKLPGPLNTMELSRLLDQELNEPFPPTSLP